MGMGKIVGMIFGAIAAILAVFTGYFKFTKKPLPAFLANKLANLANFPKVLQFFNTPSPMMAQQMLMQQQTMIDPAAQAAEVAGIDPNQLAAMQQQGTQPLMGGKRTKRTKKTKRTRKN